MVMIGVTFVPGARGCQSGVQKIKKGARKSTLFLGIDFTAMVLPGAADRVDPELIRVCWPVRRCTESSAASTVGWYATKLVIDRSHRVLGNTPRVVLLHRHNRRNDQCSRLTCSHPVVAAVPRPLGCLIASPVIAPTRVPCPRLERSMFTCIGSKDPAAGSETVATEMMTMATLARARVAVADDDTLR